MRVAPYRSTDNLILGCVITLVDVTVQTEGLMLLHNAEARLSDEQTKNKTKESQAYTLMADCTESLDRIVDAVTTVKANELGADERNKKMDEILLSAIRLKKIVASLTQSFTEE